MKAELYCIQYNISPVLAPLMNHLHIKYWHLFHRREARILVEGSVLLRTGYYDYTGIKPIKKSYAAGIEIACKKIGFQAIRGYDAKKHTAINEWVKIIIEPTASRVQQEAFNK